MEDADCIIALPGGLGTWDEVWEVLCLNRLGEHEEQETLTKRIPCLVLLRASADLRLLSNLREARTRAKVEHALRVWAVVHDVVRMLLVGPPPPHIPSY